MARSPVLMCSTCGEAFHAPIGYDGPEKCWACRAKADEYVERGNKGRVCPECGGFAEKKGETHQCTNCFYVQSCTCGQTVAGEVPCCPMHDNPPTVTTTPDAHCSPQQSGCCQPCTCSQSLNGCPTHGYPLTPPTKNMVHSGWHISKEKAEIGIHNIDNFRYGMMQDRADNVQPPAPAEQHEFPNPRHDEACVKCAGFEEDPCEPPKKTVHPSSSAEKPAALKHHICRFNDGEQVCDCYMQGYIEEKEKQIKLEVNIRNLEAQRDALQAKLLAMKKTYVDNDYYPSKSSDESQS